MQKEVSEKIAALILAAFGLIAGLAWNTAIQEIFRLIFGQQSDVLAMIAYAVIVTIIAVVVTIWIGRVAEKIQVKSQRVHSSSVIYTNTSLFLS
jgi:MFS-type transporter involved in bile tolerance (Atg22 family)